MSDLRHPITVIARLTLAICVAGLLILAWGTIQAVWGDAAGPVASPTATAIVRVGDGSTSTYTITPGSLITVPIQVVDASNLGAATVAVTYDPAVVRPVGCAPPADSVFDGGACNLVYAPDAVRFNVVAINGMSGNAIMMEIGFRGVGGSVGATHSVLRPLVTHFADLSGNDLPVSTAAGAIHLTGDPPPAPVIVSVGDTFVITPGLSTEIPLAFQISDTIRLGAVSLLLRYTPDVVRPTRCVVAEGLQGYCNLGFDPTQGLLKFTLISETGLSGTLNPFVVTFEAASGVLTGNSELILIVENLADTAGASLTWQAVNGLVRVSGPVAATALVTVGEASGSYTVAHGITQTVSIWVQDVANLGAATLVLRFDPAVIRAMGCTVPVEGNLSGGACTFSADQARASVIASTGLTGTHRLVDVTFTPAVGAAVGASSGLSLTVENFVDAATRPLTSRVRNGSLIVAPGGGATVLLVRVGSSADGGAYDLPLAGSRVVTISAEGVGEIGAASVDISYDRSVVRAVACAVGPTYGGGFCNPAATDGSVRLSVIAGTAFSGTTALGVITFQPADGASAGEATPLTLTVANLAGATGEPLLYQVAFGRLTLTPATVAEPQVTLRGGEGVYSIGIGGLANVAISATLAATETRHGLGAATLLLGYDPAVVEPVHCTLQTALWGGVCNLSYAPGQIKLSALSAVGVTGTADIAEVVFRGIGSPGASVTTSLILSVSNLVDVAAGPLTYRTLTGAIQVTGTDGDRDGVGDEIEALAPNGGDGNMDGIPDAQQFNVASLPNPMTGAYVTLAGPSDVLFEDAGVKMPPSNSTLPAGATFPLGFFSFRVKGVAVGDSVALTLTYPADARVDTLYKFGPEPGNEQPHWYRFDFASSTGAPANPKRMVITYVDGRRGDADLTANGVIVDLLTLGYTGMPMRYYLSYLPILIAQSTPVWDNFGP